MVGVKTAAHDGFPGIVPSPSELLLFWSWLPPAANSKLAQLDLNWPDDWLQLVHTQLGFLSSSFSLLYLESDSTVHPGTVTCEKTGAATG